MGVALTYPQPVKEVMMNYCTICDTEFISIWKHLDAYHLGGEKNNKGNTLCPLCNIRVDNLYRHYFSDLHRHNVLKDSYYHQSTVESLLRHYETLKNEDTIKSIQTDTEHPFWITAREQLNDKDYQTLRGHIIDREKTTRINTRNSGLGRFSRTSKGK